MYSFSQNFNHCFSCCYSNLYSSYSFSALTLLVGQQEGYLACKKCKKKSRSSILAPAHPGGSGKRAVKRLWWCGYSFSYWLWYWHWTATVKGHSTASAASKLKHWWIVCREIPKSGPLRMTLNGMQDNPDVILLPKYDFPCGIWTPIWCIVLWAHLNARLNWFSHFCTAHRHYGQRQTDRPRYSVCSNRLHLASAAMHLNKNCISDLNAKLWDIVIRKSLTFVGVLL